MEAKQPRDVYSLEHELFRETVRKFFREEVDPYYREWEKDGYPRELFKTAGKYGILQAGIPEEYGGMGGISFTMQSCTRSRAIQSAGRPLGLALELTARVT